MEKKEFARLEDMCQFRFLEAGSCFHVCSQENFPVMFHNEREFQSGMNIVAYSAFLFPDIRVLTFEIMNNHFHFALSGSEKRIEDFIKTIISKLGSHPELSSSANDFMKLQFKLHPIESLANMRNVIAYINRNGAIVSSDENVFTYRWGANRFFFNRESKLRFEESGRETTCRERRRLFRSGQLEKTEGIILMDGYVSPLCFCYVSMAESFFRNSRHYFHTVSRGIEASKDIAKSIGESMFYSDEDLFTHILSIANKEYGCSSVSLLPIESKLEIAKNLHYDFNTGNKQICRLLKMDISTVNSLFPMILKLPWTKSGYSVHFVDKKCGFMDI